MKIGLLGLGTVGSGVVQILQRHADRLAARAGQPLQLLRVAVRDPARRRTCDLPNRMMATQPEAVIDDPEIDLVIELIGGVEQPFDWMQAALRSGKHLVTANKAVLAEHGSVLFPLARSMHRHLACEGAVASGIPVIATLRQSLVANEIESIYSILNGTSNFVVSHMENGEGDLAHALAAARRHGFAESDPSLDIDGSDAAQKLAILAQLAFGVDIHWRDIPRLGIDGLNEAEMQDARRNGFRIRPLACAVRVPDSPSVLDLFVAPTLVPEASPLAQTRGAENAVLIQGDGMGTLLLHGAGAGRLPTASAVVADVVDIATGRAAIVDRSFPLWPDSLTKWQPSADFPWTGPVVRYPTLLTD